MWPGPVSVAPGMGASRQAGRNSSCPLYAYDSMGRFALMAVLVVTACGGQPESSAASAARTSPSNASPSQSPLYAERCTAAQLKLDRAPQRFTEPQEQSSLSLTLTNTSSSGCYLNGYPRVELMDGAGRVLPFQYTDGGDMVVTPNPPVHVDLAPSGIGYVTISKSVCENGDVAPITGIRLTPPGESSPVGLLNPGNFMMFCGASAVPGSTLYLSPVEPTFSATLQPYIGGGY